MFISKGLRGGGEAQLLASPWSDTLDASAPGKTCIFFRDDPDADEDCLLLNVYTPAAHMPDPQALPVLVSVAAEVIN